MRQHRPQACIIDNQLKRIRRLTFEGSCGGWRYYVKSNIVGLVFFKSCIDPQVSISNAMRKDLIEKSLLSCNRKGKYVLAPSCNSFV